MRTAAIVAVVASLGLGACVNRVAEAHKTMDPWLGRSADDLIRWAGTPQQTIETKDGGEVLRYSHDRDAVVAIPVQRAVTVPADNGPSIFAVAPDPSGAFVGVDVTPNSPPRTLTMIETQYQTVRVTCYRDFDIDANRIVVAWHQHGDGC